MSIVSKHKAVFESPPSGIPRGVCGKEFIQIELTKTWGSSVDGPLLGNGDLLAVFGGTPRWPQFWITTNDFWEMKSDGWEVQTHSYGYTGPRPIGRIILDIPELEGADYHVEQDFAEAVTRARFRKDHTTFTMNSFIAANENILMSEIAVEGGGLDISLSFKFPDELGEGVDECAPFMNTVPAQTKAIDSGGVLYAVRAFETNVDKPVKAAVAAKFIGKEDVQIRLAPGERIKLAVVVRSWEKTIRPLEFSRSRAAYITSDDADMLFSLHKAWWENYWSQSCIALDDPIIEQRYYLSQYVAGSLCRDPDFPPSIFGVQTWDDPAWAGDYKINYNHQSVYYGMYTAGHFKQADVHDAPYLALMEQGRETAAKQFGHRGIIYAIGIGPKGLICENGLWGMKSHLALGTVNMWIRWNMTHDTDYAFKIYPFVREVMNFWEDDLIFENGRYCTVNDCAHETAGTAAKNGASGLGYIRIACKLALALSESLCVDENRREKWNHILENLSPFPTMAAKDITIISEHEGLTINDLFPPEALEGKEVLILEEEGAQWDVNTSISLKNVYPNGLIGFDTDEKLLSSVRNTFELKALYQEKSEEWSKNWNFDFHPSMIGVGGWYDYNHTCLFYPIAARLGYDPENLWERLRHFIAVHCGTNGFLKHNPHGAENISTLPSTIHEMMLMSYEGIIRLFKAWPRKSHPNASFKKLRAYGAFQVSASLHNAEVCDVHIFSDKGIDCVVENPWKGKNAVLRGSGTRTEELSGDRFSFKTSVGESITLEQCK